ncbi:unnamed protein product [Chondrus crispus]|uniref:Uncharacterized protein n=1 Tax=Chondrus crispus TaxID=2769 RepID=R7QAP3_CHOCR|nr:unnamed protein product [Chondrus crispus]CDF35577.1 unnamed protein product [Chondrus crispus]|eukprot:XP_005715396.1 unnamed protein product [Chondrus crispus]
MEKHVEEAIKNIHGTPTQAVVYVTGGASHALPWLLCVPGASNTVIEGRIPYSRNVFSDLVGQEQAAAIECFSSPSAARVLAREAYRRAVRFSPPGTVVCGIAAACALATVNSRKGDHAAYVATYSQHVVAEYALKMQKGHRSRMEEDMLTSRLVIQALVEGCRTISSCGVTNHPRGTVPPQMLALSRESAMELVREDLVAGDTLLGPVVHEHSDAIGGILRGELRFAEYSRGVTNREATSATLVFPGSFNPLHRGHQRLMAVAQDMYPRDRAAYEISITNVDKPALKAEIAKQRVDQFGLKETVLVTSAPLFSEKAELFPNSKFVVGVDTAFRLVTPRYYGGEGRMISALADIKARGCRFLVGGRVEQGKDGVGSNRFLTMRDVQIPGGFDDLFEMIPQERFREDVSSSDIRAQQARNASR